MIFKDGQMAGFALPKTLDDFTADWMQQALRTHVPAARVHAAKPTLVIQGTGTKMLMEIVAEGGTPDRPLPASVCVKGAYSPNSEYLMPRGRYINEAVFYKSLQPELGMRCPQAFFAEFDTSGQSVIVMEDLTLRDIHFNLATETVAVDAVRSGLRQLAKIHARWWNGAFLDTIASLGPALPGGGHEARQREPATWAKIMTLPRAAQLPSFARDVARMGAALDRLRQSHLTEPFCLLHGDPHIGNTYIDEEGALGFYDWQTLARGSWAHDVNYLVGSTLSIDDRRHCERDLLQDYLTELHALGGPAIPLQTAWEDYILHDAYGLFFWTVNPVEMQSEENNIAVAERFAAAAADHDCLGALGV